MKGTSVLSFLITLLLAGAVCIQGQVQVNDTNGDAVQIGEQYYIRPWNTIYGNYEDGLVPVPDREDPFCRPFGISQGLFSDQLGLPVSFGLPYCTQPTDVQTYMDVTIEFKSNSSLCGESKFWKVDENSTSPAVSKVLVGGNPKSANSWFRIKEDPEGEGTNTYVLSSCTAGIVRTTRGPWSCASALVLSNDDVFKKHKDKLQTLFVKFEKVTTATTSTPAKDYISKF